MSSLLEAYYPAGASSSARPKQQTDAESPLPIPTFTSSRNIEGVHTTLMVQTYDDRILVLVSQMEGKIGCLTQATLPSSIPLLRPARPDSDTSQRAILSMLPPPHPSTSLTPLLGAAPDPVINDTYTSQIATLVWMLCETALGAAGAGAGRRGVIVGLVLKQRSRGGADEGDDSGEAERRRFAGVMELVAAWPGPERRQDEADNA